MMIKPVPPPTKHWTITNMFMLRDKKAFDKWVAEIQEAYGDDIKIVIRQNHEAVEKLNEMAKAVNNIEKDKLALRPKDSDLYGLYIEGDFPSVRMKSVKELELEGETEVEEPEVRDIDFLEELCNFIADGEVGLITSVSVSPETMVSAKGFVFTSTGVTHCPKDLPAYLFGLGQEMSKYPITKLPQ